MTKPILKNLIYVLPAIFAYIAIALNLDFFQDDAFISYRYVQNFLNGDGLVFNIGERVEGFTNFGWIVYLILWDSFCIDFILVSKVTGILLGAAFILVTYLTALRLFDKKSKWFALLPVYLLAASMSLPYWSQSGLETAAFAFFAALSFYFYLKQSWQLVFALTIAVWLRPEGALVAVMLIVIEAVVEKRIPKFAIACAAIALIFSLPFAAFKQIYYGSILPNPFYAKTGLSIEQLTAGLEYAGRFFSHYGFYGAGLIICGLFWKKLSNQMRAVLLFFVMYTLYIILVGGDVLKVHRFFIPVLGLSGILVVYSIWFLVRKLSHKTLNLILLLSALPLLFLTYTLPKDFILYYSEREKGLVESMQLLARDIKASDPTDFSAAHSTIGAFSYELMEHKIIDMLGLTDTMIARHPQALVKELESTWRERKYNAGYVLERGPEYIVFSTGDKPSAPAEQALLLYHQFLESYVSIGWFHANPAYSLGGTILPAFRKARPLEGEIKPAYPPEFVSLYKLGIELYGAGKYREAISAFDRAISISPTPVYNYLLFYKSLCHMQLQQHDTTRVLLSRMLAQDSLLFDAHRNLYIYSVLYGDSTAALLHERWVKNLVPWLWPRIQYDAQLSVSKSKIHSPTESNQAN